MTLRDKVGGLETALHPPLALGKRRLLITILAGWFDSSLRYMDEVKRPRVVIYVRPNKPRPPLTLEQKVENISKRIHAPDSPIFDSVRESFDAHDKTCESLPELWLGRRGGVSDLISQGGCAKCETWFYNEGFHRVWLWDDYEESYDPEYVCECCSRGEPEVEYDKTNNYKVIPYDGPVV